MSVTRTPGPVLVQDSVDQDYVSQLTVLTQKKHWPLPRFEQHSRKRPHPDEEAVSADGVRPFIPHQMTVYADITNVDGSVKQLVAVGGASSNKKVAKQLAAKALLRSPVIQTLLAQAELGTAAAIKQPSATSTQPSVTPATATPSANTAGAVNQGQGAPKVASVVAPLIQMSSGVPPAQQSSVPLAPKAKASTSKSTPPVVLGPTAAATLNELAQTLCVALPTYTTVTQEGPAHMPTFAVEVSCSGSWGELTVVGGTASSRQNAKQLAAQAMLDKLKARGVVAKTAGGTGANAASMARAAKRTKAELYRHRNAYNGSVRPTQRARLVAKEHRPSLMSTIREMSQLINSQQSFAPMQQYAEPIQYTQQQQYVQPVQYAQMQPYIQPQQQQYSQPPSHAYAAQYAQPHHIPLHVQPSPQTAGPVAPVQQHYSATVQQQYTGAVQQYAGAGQQSLGHAASAGAHFSTSYQLSAPSVPSLQPYTTSVQQQAPASSQQYPSQQPPQQYTATALGYHSSVLPQSTQHQAQGQQQYSQQPLVQYAAQYTNHR